MEAGLKGQLCDRLEYVRRFIAKKLLDVGFITAMIQGVNGMLCNW
jgi:hypothetical protein